MMEQNIEAAISDVTDGRVVKRSTMNLHISEKRLIDLIRSIRSGEITSIKIQNGLPIFYIINLRDRKFL